MIANGRWGKTRAYSASIIPDRTAYLLNPDKADDPYPIMKGAVKNLIQAKAKIILIACNTAHAWYDRLHKELGPQVNGELLHIVDSVLAMVAEKAPGAVKIGLLATDGTIQSGIYQKRSDQLGHTVTWVVPDPQSQKDDVMRGIYDGVKANNYTLGEQLLTAAAHKLIDQGVTVLSLSCTEIPLVLKQENFKEAILIDASKALATLAVKTAVTPYLQKQQEQKERYRLEFNHRAHTQLREDLARLKTDQPRFQEISNS